MNGIVGILSALGLSTAAGLNAYIPLLTVGLIARYTDLIQLNAPYDIIENPIFLLAVAAITLLDMVGDKIPAVDHALHLVGMVIHPAAGAVVFLASNSAGGTVDPLLAAIAGLLIAGGTHAARATVRPVATATTGGVANPVISFAEDVASLTLSVLAIVVPVVAAIVLLIAAFVVFRLARRLWPRRTTPA